MKSFAWILVFSIVLTVPQTAGAGGRYDAATQQELDAACEAARQERLKPERERYIEECVEKKQRPDRESCERFYADYGNQSGRRAPLYYDLPECVEAFEYRKNG